MPRVPLLYPRSKFCTGWHGSCSGRQVLEKEDLPYLHLPCAGGLAQVDLLCLEYLYLCFPITKSASCSLSYEGMKSPKIYYLVLRLFFSLLQSCPYTHTSLAVARPQGAVWGDLFVCSFFNVSHSATEKREPQSTVLEFIAPPLCFQMTWYRGCYFLLKF